VPTADAAISTSDATAWEKMLSVDSVTVGQDSAGSWGATGNNVTIPETAVISSIQLIGVCKGNAANEIIFILSNIAPNDAIVYSDILTGVSSAGYVTANGTVYTTNPQDSAAWTIAKAKDSTFGITRPGGAGQVIYLDEMHKKIDYTVPIVNMTGLELISTSTKIEVSGKAYTDETLLTYVTNGTAVKLKKNGVYVSSTTTTSGTFTFSDLTVSVSDVLTVYMDSTTYYGLYNMTVVDNSADFTGISLYSAISTTGSNLKFNFVDGSNAYSTTEYLPDVEKPMEMRGQTIPLLSGGTFISMQTDANYIPVVPEIIILRWPYEIPDTLLGYFEAAFLAARSITCAYPWRSTTELITGHIIPNGFKVTQRRGGIYSLEITILASIVVSA
jgi:hypothetical protein